MEIGKGLRALFFVLYLGVTMIGGLKVHRAQNKSQGIRSGGINPGSFPAIGISQVIFINDFVRSVQQPLKAREYENNF
jgi:hypothetical protein